MGDEFQASLCNCCADGWMGCCMAMLFPPCYIASTRTKYDESNCIFNFLCMTGPATRSVIREGYGIDGNCCNDIFIMCCCHVCGAVQLRSEVKKRGPISNLRTKNSATVKVHNVVHSATASV